MTVSVIKGNNKGVLSPSELTASQTVGRVSGPLVFAWDHRTNQYVVLNQGFLAEACVVAELYAVLGRIFEDAELTIEAGTTAGTDVTVDIDVPAGELWFVRGITVTPTFEEGETGTCTFNIAVTPSGGTAWNWYDTNQSLAAEEVIDVDSELTVPLRLVAGSKLTLTVRVTDDFVNEATVSISVSGTKNRRIV